MAEVEGVQYPELDANGNTKVALPTIGLAGMAAVTVVNVPVSSSNLNKSWQITVLPNVMEVTDICVWNDLVGPKGRCYLAGGKYRCRTPAVEGSAFHFALVDRDDVAGLFGMYGLTRTHILLNTVVGTIAPGEIVTGITTGQTTRVLSVNGTTLDVSYADGPFQDGESVTFSGGATAVCFDWVEGDVIELGRSVKDEWLEGLEVGEFKPGDSRELVAGLYLRVIVYNASQVDSLRVKVTLELATE